MPSFRPGKLRLKDQTMVSASSLTDVRPLPLADAGATAFDEDGAAHLLEGLP